MTERSRALLGFVALVSGFFLAIILGRSARAYEPPPVIAPMHSVTAGVPPAPALHPWTASVPYTAPPAAGMCLPYGASADERTPLLPDRMGVLLASPPTEAESLAVVRAIKACAGATWRTTDPWQVLALLRLEPELGVPESVRGLTVAMVCVESSLRASPRSGGLWRGDSSAGGTAHAYGPFQLHEAFVAACHGASHEAADDLLWAASCYISLVQAKLAHAASICGTSRAWAYAEAATVNPSKYASAGCAAQSAHWRALLAMQRKRMR